MSVQQISRGVDMCEPYTKKSIVPNTGCANITSVAVFNLI